MNVRIYYVQGIGKKSAGQKLNIYVRYGTYDTVRTVRTYVDSALGVKNERAGTAREKVELSLARPYSQARTGTGEQIHFPYSADREQDWQPYG